MAKIRYDGLTEEGKPGSVYVEVDANGNLQTSAVSSTGVAQVINANGSADVKTTSDSTWSYGSWPADSYLEQSGTGAGAGLALFTSGDLSSYNVHMIQASAGVVDVEVSLDGTTYSPSGGIALQDMGATASTTFVLVTASTGVYMLRGKYKNIRLVQNGATAATAVLASGNL